MNAQFDPNKQKAVPLNANVPAVKSPNLPAKHKREFRDFDDFVRTAQALVCRADRVLPQFGSSDLKAEYLLDYGSRLMLEEFFSGVDFYSRPELYRERKHAAPDLCNVHTTRQITQRTVSEQVGLLIGSFPNGTPNSPEVYSKLLIEEIVAANPSAIVLEATCRKIRRTSKFLPTVMEILEVQHDQAEWWATSWEWIIDFEKLVNEKHGLEPIECKASL